MAVVASGCSLTLGTLIVGHNPNDDCAVLCIHANTMTSLGISSGDCVLVKGKHTKESVLVCESDAWCEEGNVMVNGSARKNLGVTLGDVVGIRKVDDVPHGTKVSVLPLDDPVEGTSSDLYEVGLKLYFTQAYRPVNINDAFKARCNMRAVEFKVTAVEVQGQAARYCIVSPNTEIQCEAPSLLLGAPLLPASSSDGERTIDIDDAALSASQPIAMSDDHPGPAAIVQPRPRAAIFSMGFDEDLVHLALTRTNGNEDYAAELLLSGDVLLDENSFMDLFTMGFEGDLVQEALQSTDGDVERALDLLLGAQQGTQHGSTFFSFSDHFTGNTVSLLQIPLLPNHQRALPQIKCPLELVKTSAMFFAQRSPTIGNKRPRQPLPPLNFMSVDYHACVIQRVMFGCVAIACQRLATTPGNVAVNSRTTWRLAELVMERVTRGRVSRVQVVTTAAPLSAYHAVLLTHYSQRAIAAILGRYCDPGKHVCHNGYIYASAHVHDVDAWGIIRDGDAPVDIEAGFEVAPGDASDVEVANAHAWGSNELYFSTMGEYAHTAREIAEAGNPAWRGKQFCSRPLVQHHAAGRVSAVKGCDILVRKSFCAFGRDTALKHLCHNGYIYASAHVHDVDACEIIRDGDAPVDIEAGFEVAPGDASDVEVVNAHAWGSRYLTFSDGTWAFTAQDHSMAPSYKGVKYGSCHFQRDEAGRVRASVDDCDVLLRMRVQAHLRKRA